MTDGINDLNMERFENQYITPQGMRENIMEVEQDFWHKDHVHIHIGENGLESVTPMPSSIWGWAKQNGKTSMAKLRLPLSNVKTVIRTGPLDVTVITKMYVSDICYVDRKRIELIADKSYWRRLLLRHGGTQWETVMGSLLGSQVEALKWLVGEDVGYLR